MIPLLLGAALAAPDLVLEGPLPAEGAFAFLPFELPAGVAELELVHTDAPEGIATDWGLFAPEGDFRGWNGSNPRPAVVGADAASPGYRTGPMTPGTWEILLGVPNDPYGGGTYRVELHFRDTPTLPADPDRGAYVPAAPLLDVPGWYAGDFHVHSVHSGDARPTLDEIATAAEQVGLDFVEISEHDTTAHLQLLSAVQARHPGVLLVPGIEWTTYRGHANAIGITDHVPFHVGARGLRADEAIAQVHAQGGLFAPTHPTLALGDLCWGCAWAHEVDVVTLDGLEVQTTSLDGTGTALLAGALPLWEAWCDAGAHPTALGGSDDHTGGTTPVVFANSPLGSPTTLVQADALSTEALLAGLRAGRTVVKLGGPDDPMLELVTDPPRDAKVLRAAEVRFTATVTGGAPGDVLELIQDGEPAGPSLPLEDGTLTHTWVVQAPDDGETRVRAQVLRDGLPRTLASYVWVRAPDPVDVGPDCCKPEVDPPACGCRTSTPAAPLALLALMLLRVRRGRGRPPC
ncbi:MAG: PHP domain-containing protein [Alphaproteobacteria bacterium]|nr:PHP domain-containing protein [Alphaproteobacteria bacterium]